MPNFSKKWKKYFEKYGTNDHEINLEIGKQEGLTEKEIVILDGKRSRKNEETLKSDSYERKICAYCDQRVAPNGVAGIKERLEDAKVRYKDKPLSVWPNEEKAKEFVSVRNTIKAEKILEQLWTNSSKNDVYLLYEYGNVFRSNNKQIVFINICRECYNNKSIINNPYVLTISTKKNKAR